MPPTDGADRESSALAALPATDTDPPAPGANSTKLDVETGLEVEANPTVGEADRVRPVPPNPPLTLALPPIEGEDRANSDPPTAADGYEEQK